MKFIHLYTPFTELSLSTDNAENHNNHSNHRLYIFEANSRARLPYVHYYSNQYGDIIRVTELSELPDRLALVDNFIIGVVINDSIYPIYNSRRQQVLARSHTGRHVLMTQELRQRYGHYFRRPHPQHPSSTTSTEELHHHPANWRLGLP